MKLIDTHTHLYLDEFENDSIETVKRAISNSVTEMIMPNVDLTTVEPMKKLHTEFPNNLHMAMGLHPTSVDYSWKEAMKSIEAEFENNDYVAVGEVGIDLYWDETFKELQMEAFDHQLSIAEKKNIPVIIHSRKALNETLEVLESFKNISGVFHSFDGTIEDMERVMSKTDNFFFGINGIVTFKNSNLKNVVPAIGINRILLETDSPYLSPVPHRGKRCESSFLVHTASYISDLLQIPIEETARITTESAKKLFSI